MKFYWMFDNHTFREIGTDLDAACEAARTLWHEDPWGTLFGRDQAENEACHATGKGSARKAEFDAALDDFKATIRKGLCYQI